MMIRSAMGMIFLLIFSNRVWAESLDKLESQAPNFFSTFVKMISALSFILCVILLLLYFLKRLSKTKHGQSKEKLIKIIESTYIGAKKTISIVEVAGSVLVLGITEDNISLLTKIEKKEILDQIGTMERGNDMPSFSKQLESLTSKFKKNGGEVLLPRAIDAVREKFRELKKT